MHFFEGRIPKPGLTVLGLTDGCLKMKINAIGQTETVRPGTVWIMGIKWSLGQSK
jgi:hypothetical protein